jgi:hypothetical protein
MRKLALLTAVALAACGNNPNNTATDTGAPGKADASTGKLDAGLTVDAGACSRPLCGGVCCAAGKSCNTATNKCEACVASCSGKQCGDDTCGGTCPPGCGANSSCEAATGLCKVCTTVMCNGVCCAQGQICDSKTLACADCTPTCDGKDCGDNGCGGQCGSCLVLQVCQSNKCVACPSLPMQCNGASCGLDPNNCVCGTCSSDKYCSSGKCAYCAKPLCGSTCCLEGELCDPYTLTCKACQPACTGKTCGDDGCGGTCTPGCQKDQSCGAAFSCAACKDACGTRQCGPDSAGCMCGGCTGNTTCIDGLCQPCDRQLCNGVCCAPGTKCDAATSRCQRCEPQCGADKVCGDDSCGSTCGSCGQGTNCQAGKCQACQPACTGKDCGDDGCGGTCGAAAGCDQQQSLFCIGSKCTQCSPEQDTDICARIQAECGQFGELDNCGNNRGINCGDPATKCTGGKECDPVTHKCAVPCVPESDPDFCKRLGRDCGYASGTDNCGAGRSVPNCGKCSSGTCTAGKCQ